MEVKSFFLLVIQTALLRVLQMLMQKNLKLIYSECQLEQLIKNYTRISVATTDLGEQRYGQIHGD